MLHFPHHHSKPHEEHVPATRGRLIRWAGSYDLVVNVLTLGRRMHLRRTTVALAGLQPDETVLEVGCGTGDVAIAAAAYVGKRGTVVGIDPSPEMIAVARAKAARAGAAVDFQIGVIEALAFPDATFDVALSSLMMHHLPADLKRQGLTEIARVLRPGGRLLIVDFARPSGLLGRVMSVLAHHDGLEGGVQDLPPVVAAAGFVNIETGQAARSGFLRTLGFVRGRTLARG